METKVEQFNNFSGGIHSELRANYETPRFARLWNFDVSHDRAIQHYGFREINNKEGYLLPDGGSNLLYGSDLFPKQNWDLNNQAILVDEDLGYTYLDLSCGAPLSGTATMQVGSLAMSAIPVRYEGYNDASGGYINHIIYMTKDPYNRIWYHDPYSNTSIEILPDVAPFSDNTFFQVGLDKILYIFSGRSIHSFQLPGEDGKFPTNNNYSEYLPLFQYMQSGDRNGNVGTYTGLNGPETQTLSQITNLQSLLNILGFYDGVVDGIFGPNTEQAVMDFQSVHEATGSYSQSAGDPLVVDGIVGPETQSALNDPDHFSSQVSIEKSNILDLPYNITAVNNHGGYIVFSCTDNSGNAITYYWDRSLDKNGKGDLGLLTSVDMGQGVVQCLNTLDGSLIAIMTPSTTSRCTHKYNKLFFYKINAGFDFLPHSQSILMAEYRIINKGDGNPDGTSSKIDNYINQRTYVYGSKMYFSGRLHIQRSEDGNSDEGATSGVFSIDINGNLHSEVCESDSNDEFTWEDILSFLIVDSGFAISGDGDTFVNDSSLDQRSGLITKIINGGQPWRNKQIENIYLAIDEEEGLDSIEIYLREVMNKNDNDAGWVKIYDDKTSEEKRDFKNRVHINRNTLNLERFEFFRELQVMVIINGRCVEVVDLTVSYNMLDLNK